MCSNDKTMGVFIYLFFILSIFNMRTTFTFRLICLLLYYQYILETWDGETVTHFTHTQTYIYIYIYIRVVRLQLIPSCKSNSYESFIHLALQVHHTFILLHLTSFIIPRSLLHFLPDYLISTYFRSSCAFQTMSTIIQENMECNNSLCHVPNTPSAG